MKFKLKHLFFISFFIIFVVVEGILYTQYLFSKKILVKNFINEHLVYSIEIENSFKKILSEIEYIFNSNLEDNIKKLEILQLLYNDKDFSASFAANILNKDLKNKLFHYEVFIIDRNYKIIDASYKPDLGLNLGSFKVYRDILKSVFDGKKKIDINYSPHLDISSENIKQYFLILSPDKKYLLQLAFVVDLYSLFKQRYEEILKVIPDLKSLEVYFIEKYYIYKFDFNQRYKTKLPFKILLSNSKKYLLHFAKELSIDKGEKLKNRPLGEILEYFFKQKNKFIKIDFDKKVLINYRLVKGFFEDRCNNKLILKIKYDLSPLLKDISYLFEKFLIISFVLILSLVVIYYLIISKISRGINDLIKDINSNKKSNIKTYILELKELVKIYNEFREKLNKEVIKNKELLISHKRFIVDTIHQIKTPLSVITLNLDFLKIQNVEDKDTLEEIEASVKMLRHSYEDLSFISGNGIVVYEAKDFLNISEVLKERINFLSSLAKANNKEIVENIEGNLFFKINKIELERIIDNNLTNAIKYGIKNKIFVNLYKKDKNIILEFESFGEKIKNPFNIFEKNYREHSHKRGLGIGLNIVKEICKKYNIKYEVDYKEGKNIFRYIF